jgi:DNA polymerase-1
MAKRSSAAESDSTHLSFDFHTVAHPKIAPQNTCDDANVLYLIDISSFIFRAFFAIRSLKTKTGEPTNAVYGVATMLARLAEEAKPEYLAVIYDSKEASFRKEIYPEYKANRTAPPDDLVPQFARVEDLIRRFEIHSYRQSGVEADDLIATLTKRWTASSPQRRVVVVTSDKDLMQLVTDRVTIWDTMKNKFYGPSDVVEKFGVRPDQIRDYLALVGDSSDNIPGVTGIGPKGAADLLKEFGTLEGILAAAKNGKIAGKKGETLVQQESEAKISAVLATIKEDLPVEIPLESLRYRFHVNEDCAQLLRDLDFHSLVTKWSQTKANDDAVKVPSVSDLADDLSDHKSSDPDAMAARPPAGTPAVAGSDREIIADPRFRTLNDLEELKKVLLEIEKVGEFGFDLETTSLNPREAQIVGIAICHDLQYAYYIPVGHRDQSVPQLPRQQVLDLLKPLLESTEIKKIGQNLKYDWSVLYQNGIRPRGIGADTMVAAYLLEPGGRQNLATLSAHYLGYEVVTFEQICGKGKDQITFDQVSVQIGTRYSAEDAWLALQLWHRLKPLLESEGLNDIFQRVDLPLVQVLTEMELEGVCIDVPWLNQLSREFDEELVAIELKIQAFTQGPVNLNSPKQLAKLLFEDLKLPTQGKTKTGFSTDVSVLQALAPLHEVPALLMEYREISKLKGTYVDPLPELRDAKTGKIHASFHQTVAATGRLSSSDPNLQNIPTRTERGMKIRRGFVPSPGNLFVAADYSQIELRLLADMSKDPELIESFRKNEDVHKRTASEIFGVPVDQVDDRQRGIAKAINFGLMYGKTAFGLSQELRIPRKEAQAIIDKYFERYVWVKVFLDEKIKEAKENGFVVSLLGRKRRLPDVLSKNHAIRTNAERMAMNTPIQATAADMMKLAMIETHRRLQKEGFRAKLIIQVHDELILDCPMDEVERVKCLLTDVMEGAMKLSVPLVVNSGSGQSWQDL